MGKGNIIGGGVLGWYNVNSILNPDNIIAEVERLDAQILIYEEKVATATDEMQKNIAKVMLFSLQRRREQVEKYKIEEEHLGGVWCADRTEGITGEVGLIEVPGESVSYNIQPGYEGNAAYNAARDGQLIQTRFVTPESAFYNIAMLPGWQKWKPTFRYGTITQMTGATASIELEGSASTQQSLDVNQADILTDVPFEYMQCNEGAFNIDDVVLIKFENQDWLKPKVIGFKEEPKACGFYIKIMCGDRVSMFDSITNALATDILRDDGELAVFPCHVYDIRNFYDTHRTFGTKLIATHGYMVDMEFTPIELRDIYAHSVCNSRMPNPTPMLMPSVDYLGNEDGYFTVDCTGKYENPSYPICEWYKSSRVVYPRAVPEGNHLPPVVMDYAIYGTGFYGLPEFTFDPERPRTMQIASLTSQNKPVRCFEVGVEINAKNNGFTCYQEELLALTEEEITSLITNFYRYGYGDVTWTIANPFNAHKVTLPKMHTSKEYDYHDCGMYGYTVHGYKVTTSYQTMRMVGRGREVKCVYSSDEHPCIITVCAYRYSTTDAVDVKYEAFWPDTNLHEPYRSFHEVTESNYQEHMIIDAGITETTPETYMDADIYNITNNTAFKNAIEAVCEDNSGKLYMDLFEKGEKQ